MLGPTLSNYNTIIGHHQHESSTMFKENEDCLLSIFPYFQDGKENGIEIIVCRSASLFGLYVGHTVKGKVTQTDATVVTWNEQVVADIALFGLGLSLPYIGLGLSGKSHKIGFNKINDHIIQVNYDEDTLIFSRCRGEKRVKIIMSLKTFVVMQFVDMLFKYILHAQHLIELNK
jgi:hypothetical protein